MPEGTPPDRCTGWGRKNARANGAVGGTECYCRRHERCSGRYEMLLSAARTVSGAVRNAAVGGANGALRGVLGGTQWRCRRHERCSGRCEMLTWFVRTYWFSRVRTGFARTHWFRAHALVSYVRTGFVRAYWFRAGVMASYVRAGFVSTILQY